MQIWVSKNKSEKMNKFEEQSKNSLRCLALSQNIFVPDRKRIRNKNMRNFDIQFNCEFEDLNH